MRDFVRKPKSWAGVLIVLALLFALIYSFIASMNTNLPSYVEPEPSASDSPEPDRIDTVPYQSEEIAFSMSVPAGWTQVFKGGNDAFINSGDGATLVIQVSPYDPSANLVTEDVVASEIAAAGGILGGFTKDGNSAYLSIYEIGDIDTFEYTTWDRSTFIRITFQVPAARYADYYETAIYLFDTLNWEKEDPIPEGLSLFYSSFGNFEFGVPDGWSASIENGTYIAAAPNGSSLTASVTQTESDLSTLSQLDYVATASQGKQDYMLTTYSNTGILLVAEASYTIDSEPWISVNNILINGSYLYEFTFSCRQENYSTDGSLFLTAMDLFRIF